MPRIFAPNEAYNSTQGYVDFINGAAAVPATATEAIAFFTAKGLDVDVSKHALTVLDTLTRAQLNAIATYFGITLDPADGKLEVIRDIEAFVSTAKLTALTVTSVAGTAQGDTKITVAGEGAGQLVYKVTTDALTPLYKDYAGDWTEFTDGDDITAATGKKINVAEINADGYIVGFGSQTVTAKA